MFWQIVAHLLGDYFLQSDWMASEKTKKTSAAFAHVVTYTIPFLFLTQSPLALAAIAGTHFVIDRWRLARYICWAKNWLAPRWIRIEFSSAPAHPDYEHLRASAVADPEKPGASVTFVRNDPWAACKITGYASSKPPFLSVWLLIIVDNTMHIICNALALRYL